MSSSKSTNPKKDSILELAKMMDATVRVKCLGGRELQGTLRGYDELVNLVLDDCDEFLRGTTIYKANKKWKTTIVICKICICIYTLYWSVSYLLLFFGDCGDLFLDPEDSEKVTDQTRKLGLVVVRGTQVSLVSPQDGVEEIANPFLVGDDDDDDDE